MQIMFQIPQIKKCKNNSKRSNENGSNGNNDLDSNNNNLGSHSRPRLRANGVGNMEINIRTPHFGGHTPSDNYCCQSERFVDSDTSSMAHNPLGICNSHNLHDINTKSDNDRDDEFKSIQFDNLLSNRGSKNQGKSNDSQSLKCLYIQRERANINFNDSTSNPGNNNTSTTVTSSDNRNNINTNNDNKTSTSTRNNYNSDEKVNIGTNNSYPHDTHKKYGNKHNTIHNIMEFNFAGKQKSMENYLLVFNKGAAYRRKTADTLLGTLSLDMINMIVIHVKKIH